MMESLFILGIILLVVNWKNIFPAQEDPLRYIWDASILNAEFAKAKAAGFPQIESLYSNALARMSEGLSKAAWFSDGFFVEVEYIMRTRRSIDVLRKRTWDYAEQLASEYGYEADEAYRKSFACPGWGDLWRLFRVHEARIIKNESSPKYSHSQSETQNSGFKNTKENSSHARTEKKKDTAAPREKGKEHNQKIFAGIFDVQELKKKYFRLAKLNHPDHGGNDEAMKLLNRYYQEALNRILAASGAN